MDRKHFIETFKNYVKTFDMDDIQIYLKYEHTLHVAENCDAIAESLGLSEEDRDIAWETGVLHDIGRFRQVQKYHTFIDAVSVDHAELSADILFKEGMIREFDKDCENDELLELAVRQHNKYRLPESLNERELLFCRIIRDADKVDIFRVNSRVGMDNLYKVPMEEVYESGVTPEVYEFFEKQSTIPRNIMKTIGDHFIGHCALAWELVYPKSRDLVKKQGYLEEMMNFPTRNPQMKEILKDAREKLTVFLEQ